MVDRGRMLLDVSVAGLLAAVLLVVYWLDRRGPSSPKSAVAQEVSQTKGASRTEAVPVPPRFAVTPKAFDDMGKLLLTLGEGYRFDVLDEAALLDPAACARFDVIFLTCAQAQDRGEPAVTPKLASSLREFVLNGGTLYASDLRFDALAAAFPDMVDAEAVSQGLQQNLRAEVVSPELRDLVGTEMPLHFDLEGWRPAAFRGDSVTVYLRGKLRTTAGVTIDAPLLVKFSSGKGNVLFTSFHNEKQNNALETTLLKHLVVSTVAARVQTTVTQSLVRGGFTLQTSSMLTAASGESSVSKTYQHARSGGLVFTLGFEPRGAKLRLEVVSPAGEHFVKQGDSTLTIDVPDAVAGSWTYSATPERLPYPNFPFTLTVGAVSVVDAREKAGTTASAAGPRPSGVVKTGTVSFREIDLVARRPAPALRIAVTTPRFDDMGKLLRTLGAGYRFDTLPIDDLLNPAWLDRYDILFLTCNAWDTHWMATNTGEFERAGVGYGTYRRELFERLTDNVRRFVSNGGTLYASDFRYTVVAAAFPRFVHVPSELLRDLNAVESDWLRKISPKSPIATVEQAVQEAALSRLMAERSGQIVAALEGCMLKDAVSPSQADVVKALRMGGVSPLDSDVEAIGRALETRAAKIAAASSRSKNSQPEIRNLRKRLQELREQVATSGIGAGDAQVVSARVVDSGLHELLGETVNLNFETTGWDAARFAGKDVSILMRGQFSIIGGGRVEAPLLVKFPAGQGTVIFTSFHNETQNSKQEETLLRYLVFSAVNAKEEAISDKTMLSGGFSPAKRSLISHSTGQPSVTRTYRSAKDGAIRFALTFTGQGARLKFTIASPTGQVYDKEATASLIVEATGASAGEWHYTVTSLQVPYENFPFSVAVGEGAASGDRK